MPKQPAIPGLRDAMKKKVTRREIFLIIDAPSSTKNKAKARDPEMSSTKKGND
jgi:hypothetical protein